MEEKKFYIMKTQAKTGVALQRPPLLIDDRKSELFNDSSLLVDLCSKIGRKKWDLKQKVL
jgi:hypothetical protein